MCFLRIGGEEARKEERRKGGGKVSKPLSLKSSEVLKPPSFHTRNSPGKDVVFPMAV